MPVDSGEPFRQPDAVQSRRGLPNLSEGPCRRPSLLRSLAVNFVFAPTAEEMYRQPQHASVEVEGLTEHLCGPHRPGHFRGVTTVVSKLLNIVQPGRAYFGQKDGQQLAVIRRMVDELHMPLTIVGVPTVREHDGLALSSRNRLLDTQGRRGGGGALPRSSGCGADGGRR